MDNPLNYAVSTVIKLANKAQALQYANSSTAKAVCRLDLQVLEFGNCHKTELLIFCSLVDSVRDVLQRVVRTCKDYLIDPRLIWGEDNSVLRKTGKRTSLRVVHHQLIIFGEF